MECHIANDIIILVLLTCAYFSFLTDELGDYYKRLTTLIEETYKLNGNKKVALLGMLTAENIPSFHKDKFSRIPNTSTVRVHYVVL